MKFYKVEESGNYCGYDEEYLIKSDKKNFISLIPLKKSQKKNSLSLLKKIA